MVAKGVEHVESGEALPILVVLQCSMLSALAIVLGQAFAFIPNVEFVSIILFISGVLGGVTGGVVTALSTTVSFNYLNPYGPSVLPVMACQAAGWSLVAIGGALVKRSFSFPFSRKLLAVCGVSLTLAYQILVNLGFYLVFGGGPSLSAFLLAALPFSAIHICFNGIFFPAVGRPLLEVVGRMSRHHR